MRQPAAFAFLAASILASCAQRPGSPEPEPSARYTFWRPAPVEGATEPSEVVTSSSAADWRSVEPDNMLVMDLQDGGRVAAGQGAYYHVAMMNGRANQLTEMVPVERIYSELGRYIAAGATHYVLVNTSDIRPVPMTIRALMETA